MNRQFKQRAPLGAVYLFLTLLMCDGAVVAVLLSLPGVTAPFDGVFDPLRLSNTASINDIRRWRESELTHGKPGVAHSARAGSLSRGGLVSRLAAATHILQP